MTDQTPQTAAELRAEMREEIRRLREEIRRLREENARYAQALLFYADAATYREQQIGEPWSGAGTEYPIWEDQGQAAGEALGDRLAANEHDELVLLA